MFTVQTENMTIKVEFSHTRYNRNTEDCNGVTACRIIKVEDEVIESTLLALSAAICHRNDNWSYARGRKLALARAVRKAFKRYPEFQMRLLIWNCYHLTVSGGARFVQPMTGSLTGSYRGVFQYTTQGGTT